MLVKTVKFKKKRQIRINAFFSPLGMKTSADLWTIPEMELNLFFYRIAIWKTDKTRQDEMRYEMTRAEERRGEENKPDTTLISE